MIKKVENEEEGKHNKNFMCHYILSRISYHGEDITKDFAYIYVSYIII